MSGSCGRDVWLLATWQVIGCKKKTGKKICPQKVAGYRSIFEMFGVNKIINLLNTYYYEEKIQVLFKGRGWTASLSYQSLSLFTSLGLFCLGTKKNEKRESSYSTLPRFLVQPAR
jgi:hypothetical protein